MDLTWDELRREVTLAVESEVKTFTLPAWLFRSCIWFWVSPASLLLGCSLVAHRVLLVPSCLWVGAGLHGQAAQGTHLTDQLAFWG